MKECVRRENCRLCRSRRLTPVLHLASTPPANEFVAQSELGSVQKTYPLDLFFCEDCKHLQLLDVVDPEILFRNYVYVSGTSPVFVKHFEEYAGSVIRDYQIKPGSFVLDIGSNDGTLLRFFKTAGCDVLGVDPAVKVAEAASQSGIPTVPEFFNPPLARKFANEKGQASVVVANNVFAHIDDLSSVVEGVKEVLADDGVFVFEVSYLVDVVEKTLFDTIYHEHLCYHTVAPLQRFFESFGLKLFRTDRVSSHGGSLRGYVCRRASKISADGSVEKLVAVEKAMGLDQASTYGKFQNSIENLKLELATLLKDLKKSGKKVAGYGAPAKATTLMHHFGLGREQLSYIIDDSPWKQNLLSPGLHIPIVSSRALETDPPDYLLLLAWNFADSIMQKNAKFSQSGGRFILPVPFVKVV